MRRNPFLLRHWRLSSNFPLLTHVPCELFYFSFFLVFERSIFLIYQDRRRGLPETKTQPDMCSKELSPTDSWADVALGFPLFASCCILTIPPNTQALQRDRNYWDHGKMSHNWTTCTPPLSSYSSAPSIISPPVPLQSTHFVHANVVAYNHLIVFGYKKRLELVDLGQMGMDDNKTGGTMRNIKRRHFHDPWDFFFFFSGFSIVTSATLLHRLSGMVDTIPTGGTTPLTSWWTRSNVAKATFPHLLRLVAEDALWRVRWPLSVTLLKSLQRKPWPTHLTALSNVMHERPKL